MKKKEFENIYKDGVKRNKVIMMIKIETEGNPGPEIIINGVDNFAMKKAYYDKAYNDDMELIRAKESGKIVRIVDMLMTNNPNDLGWFMV